MMPLIALVDMRLRILPRSTTGRTRQATWFARLVAWLLEPINFPGKWPADDLPRRTYNREEEIIVRRRSVIERE
jgi:hypothetical protein